MLKVPVLCAGCRLALEDCHCGALPFFGAESLADHAEIPLIYLECDYCGKDGPLCQFTEEFPCLCTVCRCKPAVVGLYYGREQKNQVNLHRHPPNRDTFWRRERRILQLRYRYFAGLDVFSGRPPEDDRACAS